MAVVFVEARQKGKDEGSAISDYVVEDHADRALATFKTPKEQLIGPGRTATNRMWLGFRHINDKEKPDHWREA